MLRLVCFIGWVMVRYSATYMDGEARQGPFTAWLCLTLAAVMLLVTSANILQFALAWGRFKLAAVSSFAFVEATGPICAGKLGRDALYIAPDAAGAGPQPRLDPPLPLDAWIDAAEPILRAISLTTGFARPVVLAGHGAHVVNNPFASGLHCGACGGYAGDVNVLLLAGLLNGVDVRAGLAERDIDIPADTFFVGALHDTTTDAITLFAEDHPAGARSSNIAQAKAWFAQAGVVTRSERALRLPRADQEVDIHLRSRDWAETRPEWALAGCKAFIAAPRPRTLAKASRAGPFFMTTSGKRTRISEFCN